MRVLPLENYLYVKVTKTTEQGGIVLPEQHQTEDEIVEIIAMGSPNSRFQRGMRILCIPGSGIPTPKKDHVLVKESDVIALVEED